MEGRIVAYGPTDQLFHFAHRDRIASDTADRCTSATAYLSGTLDEEGYVDLIGRLRAGASRYTFVFARFARPGSMLLLRPKALA
jgi:hypothetical protein